MHFSISWNMCIRISNVFKWNEYTININIIIWIILIIHCYINCICNSINIF